MRVIHHRSWLLVCVVLLVLGSALPVRGQEPPAPASAQPPQADAAAFDKPYFIVLPVVYYTPETRLAFGAAGAYNFSLDQSARATRPSSAGFIVVYTQNHQTQVTLAPEIYLPHDAYSMEGTLGYELMPQDFYGVGPSVPTSPVEKFTPRSFVAAVSVRKKLSNRLFAGVQYDFGHTAIVEAEPGGLIASGAVPGSRGGAVSGLGAILKIDSRDNVQFPRSGRHFIVSFDGYASAFGSDYSYTRTRVDYRSYWPMRKFDVVAVQAYLEANSGDVPFYRLAQLGGQLIMRGYYHGQYRDRTLLALQGEYRAQVWNRPKFTRRLLHRAGSLLEIYIPTLTVKTPDIGCAFSLMCSTPPRSRSSKYQPSGAAAKSVRSFSRAARSDPVNAIAGSTRSPSFTLAGFVGMCTSTRYDRLTGMSAYLPLAAPTLTAIWAPPASSAFGASTSISVLANAPVRYCCVVPSSS